MNLPDQKGQTLLQFAAGFGRIAAVQLLLDAGGDITANADPGGSAVHQLVIATVITADTECRMLLQTVIARATILKLRYRPHV